MAEKKIDVYNFPVHECIQEQNGGPYFSSIVTLEKGGWTGVCKSADPLWFINQIRR